MGAHNVNPILDLEHLLTQANRDKLHARFWVLVICAPVGIAGYAILLAWDVPVGVQVRLAVFSNF